MFIVTHATVFNPGSLETRHFPRRFIGRSLLIPRPGAGLPLILRLMVEVEMLRYLAALLPFALAALIWRDSALAIAQAPLLMFLVVYLVEMRFFRLTPAARAALNSHANPALSACRAASVNPARARCHRMNPADNGRPHILQARNPPKIALSCACRSPADNATAPLKLSRHAGNDTTSSKFSPGSSPAKAMLAVGLWAEYVQPIFR